MLSLFWLIEVAVESVSCCGAILKVGFYYFKTNRLFAGRKSFIFIVVALKSQRGNMSLSFARLVVVCEAIYRPMIGLVPARRERSSNLRNNQNSSRKSNLMIKRHPSIKGRQRSTYENQFCLNVDFSQNRKQRRLQMLFSARLKKYLNIVKFF